jgi:hypothetical protein
VSAYIFLDKRAALDFAAGLMDDERLDINPDIFFVRGTKQSGIGVDDVREQIVKPAATRPFKFPYKIFIVENAETLLPAAQNALLKTIEEPAPYGIFLFIAPHTFNFLPTVLSRCQVRRNSQNIPFDDLVESCRGQSASLADEVLQNLEDADITHAFAAYRFVEKLEKSELGAFLDSLYVLCGNKRLLHACDEIVKTKKILSQNGNTQLAMELLFLYIAGGIS